jgi:hypothetical protein
MKIIHYIVGVIVSLLVWFVVVVLVNLVVALVFPPPGGQAFTGIGLDWRNLPGKLLGLLACIHTFRALATGPKKKDDE